MDLSQLPRLGIVAGVPGIALGAVVLLLGAVLAATNVLPEGWRGPVIVVVGVVLLGVLAVRGWARGNRADAQIAITQGDLNISCRTSKVAGFSVAFCWTARPPTADRRHNSER